MGNSGSDGGGKVIFSPIGTIKTPYKDWAPHQPVEQGQGIGKFRVEINEEYTEGLKDLDAFKYVTLIYHLDRIEQKSENLVSPPWAKGKQVGVFASRSPVRPNNIGISVVRLEKVEGNTLITWPLDILDGTPLLDIKPYMATLDNKPDADDGWVESMEGKQHLMDHLRGIPHAHDDHDHGHSHGDEKSHSHDHSHSHSHGHHHDDGKEHNHDHEHHHAHEHEHGHGHGHDHGDEKHAHHHGNDHKHGRGHHHDHEHGHKHGHKHDRKDD